MKAEPGQSWTLFLMMALSAGIAPAPAFAQSLEGPLAPSNLMRLLPE